MILAGEKVVVSDLTIPEPYEGSMATSALADGAAAATINPITDPYGSGGATPFGLLIAGTVMATIDAAARWDLVIECPINTEVCRIRSIDTVSTECVHPIGMIFVPNPSGASTSVRFIADRASGTGTWTGNSDARYNQYSISFIRLPV